MSRVLTSFRRCVEPCQPTPWSVLYVLYVDWTRLNCTELNWTVCPKSSSPFSEYYNRPRLRRKKEKKKWKFEIGLKKRTVFTAVGNFFSRLNFVPEISTNSKRNNVYIELQWQEKKTPTFETALGSICRCVSCKRQYNTSRTVYGLDSRRPMLLFHHPAKGYTYFKAHYTRNEALIRPHRKKRILHPTMRVGGSSIIFGHFPKTMRRKKSILFSLIVLVLYSSEG